MRLVGCLVLMSEFSRLQISQGMARLLLRATRTVTDGSWAWRWARGQQRRRRLSQLSNALKRVAQIRKSDGRSGDSESDVRRPAPTEIAHFRVIELERPDGAGMLLADLAFFAGFDRIWRHGRDPGYLTCPSFSAWFVDVFSGCLSEPGCSDLSPRDLCALCVMLLFNDGIKGQVKYRFLVLRQPRARIV